MVGYVIRAWFLDDDLYVYVIFIGELKSYMSNSRAFCLSYLTRTKTESG